MGCDDGHPAQYDGALDLYFLSLRNISKKWPMSIQHWQTEPNRFPIMFDEYIPQY